MIFAMAMVCFVSIYTVGGIQETVSLLHNISPTYMDWFPVQHSHSLWGKLLFIIGWTFAGFGVVGQPHIMVRFMALKNPQEMTQTRVYYYSWYILFTALTIIVGLCTRLLLSEHINFDAELALPTLSMQLLPGFLVGVVLAGLFAATMSTADSQIISCTAAISNDFIEREYFSYWGLKLLTLTVAAFSLIIALFAHDSVFNLVLIAWAALACAFSPLMILLALNKRMPQYIAVLTMITGFSAMCAWRILDFSSIVYEIMPGILAGFIPYFLYCVYKKLFLK